MIVRLESLDNETLLFQLRELVRCERENTAEVIAHLVEVDRRDLALTRSSSLYHYCVHELGYSEGEAYSRIRGARAVAEFPQILGMLKSGEIQLASLVRLYAHMNKDNAEELLSAAKGKSMRQVQAIAAELDPRPEAPDMIRFVSVVQKPCPTLEEVAPLFAQPLEESTAPQTPIPAPEPVPVKQVRFGFTADEELLQLVERAREILRHKYPRGRLEDVFRDALNALLEKRDPDRRLLTDPPRTRRPRPIGRESSPSGSV